MKTSTYLIAAAACASLQAGVFAAPCEKSFAEVYGAAAACKSIQGSDPIQDVNNNDCAKITNGFTQEYYDNARKCYMEVKPKFDDCEADFASAALLNVTGTFIENVDEPKIACGPLEESECHDECITALGKIEPSAASATQASLAVGVLAGVAAYLAPKM